MKNTFFINYRNQNVRVDTYHESKEFVIHLSDNDFNILKIEDNEGASHWFEKGKDKETGMTKEIGVLTEKNMAEK